MRSCGWGSTKLQIQEKGKKTGLLGQGEEQRLRLCLENRETLLEHVWAEERHRGTSAYGEPGGHPQRLGQWGRRMSCRKGFRLRERVRLQGNCGQKERRGISCKERLKCQASGSGEIEKTTCFSKCFVGRKDLVWMCGSPCDNEPFSGLCENIFTMFLQYLQNHWIMMF